MQQHLYCSQSINELAKAMLKVQQQLSPVVKDSTNPFTRSKYPSLNSVLGTCASVLVDNGIWLTQIPVPVDDPGYIGLVTKLTHAETGQYQASLTVLPLQKNDCQGAGSAITYARRYAITAMLGLVTEEDDDGESAKAPKASAPRYQAPQMVQTANMSASGAATRRQTNAAPAPAPAPTHESQVPVASEASLPELPVLPGVHYDFFTDPKGQDFIIATGATRPCKDTLRGLGFRWDVGTKSWWKQAV